MELENQRLRDLIASIRFELEFIRSVFIEIETISSEIPIQNESAKGTIERVRTEIGKGLQSCQKFEL